jgi:plasmid maintenance system killer protein
MLAFLDDMQDPEELRSLPAWKVHTLTGDRKGTWSLSVSRNRRLTFRVDSADEEIPNFGAPVSYAPYLDDLNHRLTRQYLLTPLLLPSHMIQCLQ